MKKLIIELEKIKELRTDKGQELLHGLTGQQKKLISMLNLNPEELFAYAD